MKLASLKSKNRDGELIVVNRSLTKAVKVPEIPTLQCALDNWSELSPKLLSIYEALNQNTLDNTFPFDAKEVNAPLPRAYQWADGSAYVNHVELVRKARGVKMPENFWTDPLIYQGGSDTFLGPTEDILLEDVEWGLDFEAELAIVTNDIPMGIKPQEAQDQILLLMLVNDLSLRNLFPTELNKGFGFFQSKPSCSFSPVAITLDELGPHWESGKVHLPLVTHFNEELFGSPNAGMDMIFDFPTLISHAAKTRRLSSGTIIGSGTVSNKDRRLGHSCIAEKRMLEILSSNRAKTPFMQYGDKVRIEMFEPNGQSLFGAINQEVKQFK